MNTYFIVTWSQHSIVSLAAVFSIVTQRSSPGGALRDDTKNGCEGDYWQYGKGLIYYGPIFSASLI